MLNENEIAAVANAIVTQNDLPGYNLLMINGQPYIQITANVLITIANSEYIQVAYQPNGDEMTDDDYTDFTEFVNALTIS